MDGVVAVPERLPVRAYKVVDETVFSFAIPVFGWNGENWIQRISSTGRVEGFDLIDLEGNFVSPRSEIYQQIGSDALYAYFICPDEVMVGSRADLKEKLNSLPFKLLDSHPFSALELLLFLGQKVPDSTLQKAYGKLAEYDALVASQWLKMSRRALEERDFLEPENIIAPTVQTQHQPHIGDFVKQEPEGGSRTRARQKRPNTRSYFGTASLPLLNGQISVNLIVGTSGSEVERSLYNVITNTDRNLLWAKPFLPTINGAELTAIAFSQDNAKGTPLEVIFRGAILNGFRDGLIRCMKGDAFAPWGNQDLFALISVSVHLMMYESGKIRADQRGNLLLPMVDPSLPEDPMAALALKVDNAGSDNQEETIYLKTMLSSDLTPDEAIGRERDDFIKRIVSLEKERKNSKPLGFAGSHLFNAPPPIPSTLPVPISQENRRYRAYRQASEMFVQQLLTDPIVEKQAEEALYLAATSRNNPPGSFSPPSSKIEKNGGKFRAH